MVEINNQRGAFLVMPGVVGGTITDVRKPQKSWLYDVIVGGEYLLITPITLANCHAKPKTQINGRRTPQLLSRWCVPTASSLAWKTSLRKKSGRCGITADKAWRTMIDRGDIRRTSTGAAISGLHCRALVMVSSGIRLTAWLQIQRSGRNGQRDRCMSRVTAIISRSLVICIIVTVMGC